MKRYVSFLRGINLSGQKLIKMEALKALFEALAFKNVVTYIQSGNVVFDVRATDTSKLQDKIEKHLLKELGYEVRTIVRSVEDIQAIVDANPFPDFASDEKRKLHVTMMAVVPDAAKLSLLKAVLLPDEEIEVIERELYMLTPSYGNTKLSNNFVEKKLGLVATTRNWATMNKVLGL